MRKTTGRTVGWALLLVLVMLGAELATALGALTGTVNSGGYSVGEGRVDLYRFNPTDTSSSAEVIQSEPLAMSEGTATAGGYRTALPAGVPAPSGLTADTRSGARPAGTADTSLNTAASGPAARPQGAPVPAAQTSDSGRVAQPNFVPGSATRNAGSAVSANQPNGAANVNAQATNGQRDGMGRGGGIGNGPMTGFGAPTPNWRYSGNGPAGARPNGAQNNWAFADPWSNSGGQPACAANANAQVRNANGAGAGQFFIDMNGDGVADAVNFQLVDVGPDGDYNDNIDYVRLSANNGVFGEGGMGNQQVRSAQVNDEDITQLATPTAIWFGDTWNRYEFTVDFGGPAANGWVSVTARAWYTDPIGGFNIDDDWTTAGEGIMYSIADTDSNGIYDTLDLSINDGDFCDNNNNGLLSPANEDERVASGNQIRIGTNQYRFTVTAAADQEGNGGNNDIFLQNNDWFSGSFLLDVDADGAADDQVFFTLTDADSNALYDTIEWSSDDNVFGEGNLFDGVTGLNNDEWSQLPDRAQFGNFHTFLYSYFDQPCDLTPDGWDDVRIESQMWFSGSWNIDLNRDGVAGEVVRYTLADMDSNGVYDSMEISSDDMNFGEGNLNNNAVGDAFTNNQDERIDAGRTAVNNNVATVQQSIVMGINSFTISFATNPAGGANDGMARADWYTGTIQVDVDASGGVAVNEYAYFSIADMNSDGIGETLDWSADDNTFGEVVNGGLGDGLAQLDNDESATGNLGAGIGTSTMAVRLGEYGSTTTWNYYPGWAANDISFRTIDWFEGTFDADLDADGTLDTINYVLTDTDSDGVYDTLDLSADDNVYGEVPGMLGDASLLRNGIGDDDERMTATTTVTVRTNSGLEDVYTVSFDPNPVRDNNDVRITAQRWYTGALSVDDDADGNLDNLYFAMGDTNSNGLYETVELSLDDAAFGEGALRDNTLSANNDERGIMNEAAPGSGSLLIGKYRFTASSTLSPTASGRGPSLNATEWFTGTFTIDADADGVADDTVWFSLADSDSNGLYDTADISTDNAVFGEGGNLSNGAAAAGDDERITGTVVSLGAHIFDVKFGSAPPQGTSDASVTIAQWYNGTVMIEGVNRTFVVADSNSDGVFDTARLDLDGDGNFAGTSDAGGPAGSALRSPLLALQYTLAAAGGAAGTSLQLMPTGASAAGHWMVGRISAEGARIPLAVSGPGTYDTADFDRNGDSLLDDAGNMASGRVSLRGVEYQLLSFDADGTYLRMVPYTGAVLGPENDRCTPDTIFHGILSESAYDLNGNGLTDDIPVVVAHGGGCAQPVVFTDTDGDGSLATEAGMAAGSSFTLGPNSYDIVYLASSGQRVGIRQLNNVLASAATAPDGSFSITPPAAGYYWLKTTSASASWGFAVLNDTAGGAGVYYDGAGGLRSGTLGVSGYAVSGAVTDYDTKAPIGSVFVEAYTASGSLVVSTMSKDDGTYRLALAGGSGYDLVFHKVGYITDDGRSAGTVRDLSLSADAAGKNVALKKDNTPPVVKILAPAEGELISGLYTIKADVTDNSALDRVEVSTDFGVGWRPMKVGVNYTYMWDTTEVPDGYYRVIVSATDNATLTTMAQKNVYVGNERVLPAVTLLSPSEGEFLGGEVILSALASENIGLKNTTFRLDRDGGSGVTLEGSATTSPGVFESGLNTTLFADGNYTVLARVADLAGNANATAPVRVFIDNTPPAVTVTAPTEGQRLMGDFAVTATASDLFLNTTAYSLDGGSWTPLATVLKTTAYSNGPHTLAVRATDIIGHATVVRVDVVIDNSGPSIVIKSGTEGKVVIRADFDPATGVRTAWVRVDGGQWKEMKMTKNNATFTYDWATGEDDNGQHTIEVKAKDYLGNEGKRTMTVSVNNFRWSLVFGLLLLVLIIGSVAYMWMRLKRAKRDESPPDGGSGGSSVESAPATALAPPAPEHGPAVPPPAPESAPEPAPAPPADEPAPPLPDRSAAAEAPATSGEAVPAQAEPAGKRGSEDALDDIMASLGDKTSEGEQHAEEIEPRRRGEL